jgi:hypothetical protein
MNWPSVGLHTGAAAAFGLGEYDEPGSLGLSTK